MTEVIRPARDDDSWDLIGLVAGCWSEYPGCVLDVHGEEPELLRPASAYADDGGCLWVAETVGPSPRLVGSVGLVPSAEPRVVVLKKLYVARPARGHGLGARLVALIESEASGRGAQLIELWSDTRFTDAHRLYLRLGYEMQPETRELHDLSNSVEHHFTKRLA